MTDKELKEKLMYLLEHTKQGSIRIDCHEKFETMAKDNSVFRSYFTINFTVFSRQQNYPREIIKEIIESLTKEMWEKYESQGKETE